MTRPIEAITNAQTGETIYQEMSDISYEIYLADKKADEIAAKEKAKAEAQAEADKASAQAKLEALGLNATDMKVLGL